MEILIIILDIIVYILIAISFIFTFKARKVLKKVELKNEELNIRLRTANLTIQILQEQLDIKRKEYDDLTSENKHLYEELKSYQNLVNTQEAIEKVAEELQENVEVEEPKKTKRKTTTKKSTTKKATTKKTTTKKTTKKKGEDK